MGVDVCFVISQFGVKNNGGQLMSAIGVGADEDLLVRISKIAVNAQYAGVGDGEVVGFTRFDVLVSGKSSYSLSISHNNWLQSVTRAVFDCSENEVYGNVFLESQSLCLH